MWNISFSFSFIFNYLEANVVFIANEKYHVFKVRVSYHMNPNSDRLNWVFAEPNRTEPLENAILINYLKILTKM